MTDNARLVDYGAARGFITSGKLQALAATTRAPHPRLPNIPTLESIGVKDYDIYGWVALFAPMGTPRPIIDRLNAEIVKAAPEVGAQFTDLGIGFVTTTPEELGAMVKSDLERWGPVIRQLNLNLD